MKKHNNKQQNYSNLAPLPPTHETKMAPYYYSHNISSSPLTADHARIGFDHVLYGDGARVLRRHHVDHLAQHVLEVYRLLALMKRREGGRSSGGGVTILYKSKRR